MTGRAVALCIFPPNPFGSSPSTACKQALRMNFSLSAEVENLLRAKSRSATGRSLGFARHSVSTSLDTNGVGVLPGSRFTA
jgi:hypothetical protein